MEELLLGAIKYVAAALGGMVFMFILDVISTDIQQDSLKSADACNGILRGEDATDFDNLVKENTKRALKSQGLTTYGYYLDETRMGWCVFKEKSNSVFAEFYSGPFHHIEEAMEIAANLNREQRESDG